MVVISSPSAGIGIHAWLTGGVITLAKTRSALKGAQRGVKVSERRRFVS